MTANSDILSTLSTSSFSIFFNQSLKAIINSIGKARENSIVKKDMKKIKKMLKFFLEIIIKEGLLDDRSSDVYNNKNIMGKV